MAANKVTSEAAGAGEIQGHAGEHGQKAYNRPVFRCYGKLSVLTKSDNPNANEMAGNGIS